MNDRKPTLLVALGKYCSNHSDPLNCVINCGKGVGGRGGEGVGGGGGVGVGSLGGGVLGLEISFSTFILVVFLGGGLTGSSLGSSGGGVGGGVGVGSFSTSKSSGVVGSSRLMPSLLARWEVDGEPKSRSSTDFFFSTSWVRYIWFYDNKLNHSMLTLWQMGEITTFTCSLHSPIFFFFFSL